MPRNLHRHTPTPCRQKATERPGDARVRPDNGQLPLEGYGMSVVRGLTLLCGAWMPGFYGKASLDSIRRAIPVWKELGDKDLRIDRMIGVHSPGLLTSRQHFQQRREYLQALLDDLIEAKQQGLSQQQAKDGLSLDERYAYVRRYFSQPQNLDERHQNNIDTIWALLPKEASSN